jgi:hypothetical protein
MDRNSVEQPLGITEPHPDRDPFPHAGPFWVAVCDATGQPIAQGDATVLRHDYSIALGPTYSIRFVHYVVPGGELLPVRPEPVTCEDVDPRSVAIAYEGADHIPVAVRHFITDRYADDGSLVSGSTITITHEHAHTHADPHPRDDPAHTHEHTHPGVHSAAAWHYGAPGHRDDLHDHDHGDDPAA